MKFNEATTPAIPQIFERIHRKNTLFSTELLSVFFSLLAGYYNKKLDTFWLWTSNLSANFENKKL